MNFFTRTDRHLKTKAYTLLEVVALTIGSGCVRSPASPEAENELRLFLCQPRKDFQGQPLRGKQWQSLLRLFALDLHANQEIPAGERGRARILPLPHVLDASIGRAQYGYPVLRGDLIEADSNFFRVFDFRFAEGDAAQALSAPDAIVLSKTA